MIARRAVVAFAATLLAACAAPSTPAGPARRIVVLAPSATETVFALGAGDRVVGVCDQCDWPPAATALPRVGGYVAPSVEAVLALRPDVVVAVPSPGNREAVRAMERAGLRIVVVRDRTLDDLWDAVATLGTALDAPDAAAALRARIRAELDAVHARVAARPPQRTLLLVGHRPLVVVGRETLQDALLGIAGGVNVAADAGAGFPQIGLETVVARAPDVIVDAAMGTEAGSQALFADLPSVPAVAHGRVVTVAPDALFRAGPRVGEAAAALAAAIHPGA